MSLESIALPVDAQELVEHEAGIAARCDDLADAHVQQAIARIQRLAQGDGASGDFAGAWFSGVDKEWPRMSYGERVDIMQRYAAAEIEHELVARATEKGGLCR